MLPTPISRQTYNALYQQSLENYEQFWHDRAKEYVDWIAPWHTIYDGNFAKGNNNWFSGAKLNVSYNCLDRHLNALSQQTAIIWESNDPSLSKKITYKELTHAVCQCANLLKSRGIKKGDRVCIYMPMIPEAAISMLACARIGAIHSVVFGGFSPTALQNRIIDADCTLLITADEGVRGNKIIPLKANCDKALKKCPNVHTVIVVKRTGNAIDWKSRRDIWYHESTVNLSENCPPEPMDANDPLFILYTSGSTGKPKGILHGSGGYLLYAALTHHIIFNYQPGDIYWCTADVGWITGHSYIVYGPLCNGATTVMFEGVPNYPDASRFWQIVDKHQVNIFYTAPTAIRALLREGDAFVKKTKRDTLKLLGTVGEPINPEVWQWYYDVVGNQTCPIVDTWWQTETGGIMISALPHATPKKPGAACWPFFGVHPAIVNDKGELLQDETTGNLVITKPWPGMMLTIYGDHDRFIQTYFSQYPGMYMSGDGARRDANGDYWITGRIDDVINVSGHRLSTAEIESALILHHEICEAAVVGYPHPIKGQGIYAFITPLKDIHPSDDLKKKLVMHVRKIIGAIAAPDVIQWAPALPKTRSGKIMRRLLRKIASNDTNDLGDISTLANPEVMTSLIENKSM